MVATDINRRCNILFSFLVAWLLAVPPPCQGEGKERALNLAEPAMPANYGTGSVRFIGNATVLIRYAGLTILTDPNFLHKGEHAQLGYGLQSERLTDPAIELDRLPPIDLVVLSHMHGDHFDHLVQQKLDRRIPIVSTPAAVDALKELGFHTLHPLHTWDSLVVRKGDASLRVTAMPARHGPLLAATLMPETMGSMLEFATGGKRAYSMYISGDTLVYGDLEEIPRRYPEIDLALLHLGGTRILGLLKVTMDGKDGAKLMRIIAPSHAIPIHYDDYDVFKSPLSDFEKEVNAAGLQAIVTYLKQGEAYRFSRTRN